MARVNKHYLEIEMSSYFILFLDFALLLTMVRVESPSGAARNLLRNRDDIDGM